MPLPRTDHPKIRFKATARQHLRGWRRSLRRPSFVLRCAQCFVELLGRRLGSAASHPVFTAGLIFLLAAPLLTAQELAPPANSTAEPPQPERAQSEPPLLFLVTLDGPVLSESMRDRVTEDNEIDENIGGRPARGRGRLEGVYTFELIPNDQMAVIEAHFQGTNNSYTTTNAGPVTLQVRGRTGFHGVTRIYITGQGIRGLPPKTNACSRLTLLGVCSRFKRPFFDKIARRIATREFYEGNAQRQVEAAGRTEEDINEELDEEMDEFTAGIDIPLLQLARRSFTPALDAPGELRFRTAENAFQIALVQPGVDALAAFQSRPTLEEPAELAVFLHEAAVNRLGRTHFAGKTFTWSQILRIAEALSGRFDLTDEPEQPGEAAGISITFAEEEPLRLSLEDGVVSLAVRAQQFQYEGETYPGAVIRVRYELRRENSHARLVLAGTPEVAPLQAAEDLGGSIQQRVQLEFIRLLLARDLQREIGLDSITATGEIDRLGTFHQTEMAIENGWLKVGFRRPAAPDGVQ